MRRVRMAAFAGRYGHQDAEKILGRPLQGLDLEVFVGALEEWLHKEFEKDEPDLMGRPRGGDQDGGDLPPE